MSEPSVEIVKSGRSELAIGSDQSFWSDKQKAALAQLGMSNAGNADLAVFFHQCVRTGLDPFARQIYMIQREGKQTIQTGIDGFRLVARRACDARNETLGYEETLWCGADGQWTDVWLSSTPPKAAKVTILRGNGRFPAIALYEEYVGLKKDKQTGVSTPNKMWTTKPALMLAKCAEALALRKAFPQDLAGLYTSDEMDSSNPPEEKPAVIRSRHVEDPAAIEGEMISPETARKTVVEQLGGRQIDDPEGSSFIENSFIEDIAHAQTKEDMNEIVVRVRGLKAGVLTQQQKDAIYKKWKEREAELNTASSHIKPSIDDLEAQISSVNSAHSFDVVKTLIEASPYNIPIKRRLYGLLDKQKEKFSDQIPLDEIPQDN